MGRKPVPAGFSSWAEALGLPEPRTQPNAQDAQLTIQPSPAQPNPYTAPALPLATAPVTIPPVTIPPVSIPPVTAPVPKVPAILEPVFAALSKLPSMDEDSKDAVLSLSPKDAVDILSRYHASSPSLDIYMEAKRKLLSLYGPNTRDGIKAVVKTLVGIDDSAKASLWDLPQDDAMNIIHKIKQQGHTWQNPSASVIKEAHDVRNRCANQGIYVAPAPQVDANGNEILPPMAPMMAPPNQQWGTQPAMGGGNSWNNGPAGVPPQNNQWDQGGSLNDGRGEKRQMPEAFNNADDGPSRSKTSNAPPTNAPEGSSLPKLDPVKMVQFGQKLAKELGVPLSSLPREKLETEMRKAQAEGKL